MAETCGAVTGAFMVLGLAHCDEGCRAAEGRKAAYQAVQSFAKEFQSRHGSLACRDLLGCDISTPEGAMLATAKGLFRSKCPELVRDAAEMVEAIVRGGSGADRWARLASAERRVRCDECTGCSVVCPNGVHVREQLIRARTLFA